MSFLGNILGLNGGNNNYTASTTTNSSNSGGSSISGAETIERLCDRLQSASLLEDRRESLKTIKSLSKKYKLEVGTQAMPVLIEVLDKNRVDSEMCCLALDSLYNVMNPVTETTPLLSDLNVQFTEMFIKSGTNLNLVFDLLDEFEFQTRWSTLKLLNVLVNNQTDQLQEIILQIPRGVSRLMDLLNDTREVIRNDTILLLCKLTKTNTNIQKIIAFESGFDRIMEIIEGEGRAADGGIVVEDCFNLLLNLLKMNYSNQNFFKEANYIKMLCKYLDLTENGNSSAVNNLASDLGDPNNSGAWTVQKTTNLSLLLKLIRCLVSPTNQQVIINDCQKAFNHFGMLHRLCAMLMMPGVPADLLSEAIGTVGEVIRGNAANQQLFSAVQMQTNPPRPILVILLMSMINEKQTFHLRCSILYSFECFLFRNEKAKSEIVETLLPQHSSSSSAAAVAEQINIGQILCSGLISQQDFVSNWLCGVALSHTISDNNQLKEQLLRVQLAVNPANNLQSVSLMQQCMLILIESTTDTTSTTTQTSGLNSTQVSQNKCKLQTTVSMLMLLSTWMSNCSSAVNYFLNHPQNIPYLISQVSSTDTQDNALIIQGLTAFLLGLCMLYNSNQVESYTIEKLKDIIKKRCGIEQFEDKLEFISQHELYTKTLRMPTFSIKCKNSSELFFDYEFTRLYKSNETLILNLLYNKNQNIPSSSSNTVLVEQQHQQQANSLIISQYQQIIREQDIKLKEYEQEKSSLVQTSTQLQEYCKSLHYALTAKDDYIKEKAHEFDIVSSEKLKLNAKINELEVKNNLLDEKCSEQEDELCKLQREKGICQETLNNLSQADSNVEMIELKTQNKQLKQQLKTLNTEQDNLLVLLSEMEQKLKSYKKALKERGFNQLSESEGDEEKDGKLEEEEEENKRYDQHLLINNQPTSGSWPRTSGQQNEVNFFDQPNNENDLYDENNRISQILQAKNLSGENSEISTYPESGAGGVNSSCSSDSSSNNENANNSSQLNYPPHTGQNIINVNSNDNVVDPFFKNHPFFKQQPKQENLLQSFFK